MAVSPVIIVLILASILAFLYKVYLQDKLNGESSSFAFLGVFRRIFGIKYVIPINKANYSMTQQAQVKAANLALVIFWTCFILAIIFGAVESLVNSA